MNTRHIWRQYAKRLSVKENAYAPRVTRLLRRQGKAFTAALRNGVTPTGMMFDDAMVRLISRMQVDMATSEARWHLRTLQAQEGKRFGRNEEWTRWMVEQLATHNVKYVVGINEATRRQLMKYLQDGLADGLTLNEIAERIETVVFPMYEARGFAIARTELNRGAGMGTQLAARSYPYETEKVWITAGDHRVRGTMPDQKFSHVMLNGQKISTLDALGNASQFNNGEPIAHPGDPNASAGNTVNCRCTMALVGKRVNGRLVPRTSIN